MKKVITEEKQEIKENSEEGINADAPVLSVAEEKDVEKEVSVTKRPGYFNGIGRRKTSTARVRLSTQGDKEILINKMLLGKYFPDPNLQGIVTSPLGLMKCLDKFNVTIVLRGGGVHSQAEAARHGISRALVLFNVEFKKRLRKAEYLTRDQRMRERKKFGLKRARRAPQWAKR